MKDKQYIAIVDEYHQHQTIDKKAMNEYIKQYEEIRNSKPLIVLINDE
jgi:hypothetical protein